MGWLTSGHGERVVRHGRTGKAHQACCCLMGYQLFQGVYDDKWLRNKLLVLVFVETDQQQFA